MRRNRLIGLGIAAFIAAVDQAVKWLVIGPLNLREVRHIDLLPFFDLTYPETRGVSLGMLQASDMEMRWLLVLLTGAIAFVVLVWMMRERKIADIAALALILGGAIGNIIDRWDLGYVIDYADFQIWLGDSMIRPFLIFNIADAAITIGVVIILARSLLVSEKDGDTPNGRPFETGETEQ